MMSEEFISLHFSEEMNPYDAAVLFWYSRNRLFFDLGLETNPNIIMCKYEHLIAEPGKVFRRIYQQLGQTFPGEKITAEIDATALRKGKAIEISPAINDLARELLDRLDEVYFSRWPTSRTALEQQGTALPNPHW